MNDVGVEVGDARNHERLREPAPLPYPNLTCLPTQALMSLSSFNILSSVEIYKGILAFAQSFSLHEERCGSMTGPFISSHTADWTSEHSKLKHRITQSFTSRLAWLVHAQAIEELLATLRKFRKIMYLKATQEFDTIGYGDQHQDVQGAYLHTSSLPIMENTSGTLNFTLHCNTRAPVCPEILSVVIFACSGMPVECHHHPFSPTHGLSHPFSARSRCYNPHRH